MKKGKKIMTITIGLMAFVLSTIIFIQFKTISSTNIVELENMREDQLTQEIVTQKSQYEETRSKYEETLAKMKEYQESMSTEKEALDVLVQEVKETNDLLGKNDVVGQGIIVTLEDTRNARISAEDLLILINLLNSGGAEAININGQRMVYDSYIVNIGNDFIRANGNIITSPYIVKAIGNPSYLESSIAQKNIGFVDEKLSEGKSIEVEQSKEITVEKYTGDLSFEYVKEAK